MKKVFSSHSECAHVWAQQTQDEGRAHSMFFEKESIYSYGHHFKIAEFIRPNVVLYNGSSRSPSTSKHQGYVHSALHGLNVEVIYVPWVASEGKVAISECCDRMMDMAEEAMKSAIKAITRTDYYKQEAARQLERLDQYLLYVKGMTPKQWARRRSLKKMLTSDDFTKLKPIVKAESEATKKRNAERKAAMAEHARVAALKYEERLAEWLAGGNVSVNGYGNVQQDAKTYLRVKDDAVQTSRGAAVDLKDAKVLLGLWMQGKVPIGYVIGSYTVEEVEKDRIKIGCHTLLREEIERIAPQLEAA